MYSLLTDNQGNVVLAGNGEESIRPPDAAWAKVEAWAAQIDPPVDLNASFPPDALLFFDPNTLAESCTYNGEMLHVTGDNFTKGATTTYGNRTWMSLHRAVAIPPQDESPRNPSGITADFTRVWVPEPLFKTFAAILAGRDDNHPLWRVSSRTVKRAFVYVDISRFSKYPPGQEALIINTLVRLLNDVGMWPAPFAADVRQSREADLCIGDGYIYVFPDPLKATIFASWLAELIQQLVARRDYMGSRGLPVAFHFRMGVHYGPVYRFWDPGRRSWNYIGDGISGGNRVLSVIDKKYDDVLYISDAVVNEFIARGPHTGMYARVRSCLESRGVQEDKHGKGWRVFLLNHTKLCERNVQYEVERRVPGP